MTRIILGSSDSLIAKLSAVVATAQPSFVANWEDSSACSKGTLNDTSEVTLIAASSADRRELNFCRIFNEDTSSVVVTVQIANSINRYTLGRWTLGPGAFVDVLSAEGSPFIVGDILSNLVNCEILVTGATTAILSTMHVCSGTTSDYTVTLPPVSGSQGKFIGLRMDPGLTKLVTIDGNASELIDGAVARIMWANETAILYCNGVSWTKIAGKTIAMRADMVSNASQDFPLNTITKINLAVSNLITPSIANMIDGTNKRICVRRPGDYITSHTLVFKNTNATACNCFVRNYKNGSETGGGYSIAYSAASVYCTAKISILVPMVAGDYIETWGEFNAGEYTTSVVHQATLCMTEIPFW